MKTETIVTLDCGQRYKFVQSNKNQFGFIAYLSIKGYWIQTAVDQDLLNICKITAPDNEDITMTELNRKRK